MATSKASSLHLETIVVELAALEDIAQVLMDHTSQNLEAGAAGAFRAKCDNFIKEGELQLLVETFVDALEQVGPSSSLEDMEARFSIMFSLARHLPPEVLTVIVPRVSKVVLAFPPRPEDNEKDQAMRMSVLRNLYTVVDPKSSSRFGTLSSMLQYALENEIFAVWDGTRAMDVEEVCKQWTVSEESAIEQKRVLYKLYCDIAQKKMEKQGPSMSEEDIRTEDLKQHRFLMKMLETYEMPAAITPPTMKDFEAIAQYAKRAAVIAIKYPLPRDMAVASTLEGYSLEGMSRAAAAVLAAEQTQRVDSATLTASASTVINYQAVKHLEMIPEYNLLYQLLLVFAAKGLEDFVEYQKKYPTVLKDLGLNEENCLKSIRLLTLASLAAEQEVVSYDVIASKLNVDRGMVEKWVIDGIISKLIDAKMDQKNQTIVINRGSQRLLTESQWEQVQGKLSQWKTSVRTLLKTVQNVHQEHVQAQQKQQQQQQPQQQQPQQ